MDKLPNVSALIFTSLLGLATAVAVMAGWVFDLSPLLSVFSHYATMKFNTALCFALLSAALLLTQLPARRYKMSVFLILSFSVTGIAAVSVSQYLFPVSGGIDQLLLIDKVSIAQHYPYPGRMSVNTALSFMLFGLSLIGFSTQKRALVTISQYLLHIVSVISGLSLVGYLYALPLFYQLYFDSSMAVHTALLFFLLSLSASLLRPVAGLAGLFTGTRIGNSMARRVFLFIICIIIVFGAVRTGMRQYSWFSARIALSLLVICFMAFGLALIWHTAGWLNKFDSLRHDAEEEIKVMNELLEKRVEERSGKLRKLLAKLRESEIKFRAAFEHSAMGIALVSLKGKWLKVNKRLCDIVGYREQELLSMSFHDLTGDEDGDAHLEVINEALKNKDATYRIEKRYKCKNGATAWVSINIAAATDKKGGPVYFVSQFEDITERKKAEKHLKDAYKRIQDHVETIKEIAWKQSHLIRSPVANLKGLVEILQTDPAEKDTLKYVQLELERLDAVILEMAEDACSNGATEVVVKKRCLTFPASKLISVPLEIG